jgi:hypothetical protein
MPPNNKILIRRRLTGNAGAPSSLHNGELAFNEVDSTLYYGAGDNGSGIATNIIPIGGSFTSILKNASVETISTPTSASNDFLIVEINGRVRAIRLWDF